MPKKRSPKQRLLERIKKVNGCWEVSGFSNHGYRRIWVNGQTQPAHRLAYELFKGRVAKGQLVLHRCDNRACANPKHLWLGSQRDNVHDAISKGRHQKHDRNGRAKLNPAKVAEIRALLGTMPKAEIARKYGVTPPTIGHIAHRRNWL